MLTPAGMRKQRNAILPQPLVCVVATVAVEQCKLQIRKAMPSDGQAFIALVRLLADYEKLPAPNPEAEARLLRDAFSAPPKYQLWVATIDQKVIAYAAWFFTYSTFRAQRTLYLEDIFVHPDERRKQVASTIMKKLKQTAIDAACGRFEWSVLDWNHDAQKLYAGLGAEFMKGWQMMRMDLL